MKLTLCLGATLVCAPAAQPQTATAKSLYGPLVSVHKAISGISEISQCDDLLLRKGNGYLIRPAIEEGQSAPIQTPEQPVVATHCIAGGWLFQTVDSLGRADAYYHSGSGSPLLRTPYIPACCGAFGSDYAHLWHVNGGRMDVSSENLGVWKRIPLPIGLRPVSVFPYAGRFATQFDSAGTVRIGYDTLGGDGIGWRFLAAPPVPGRPFRLAGYYGNMTYVYTGTAGGSALCLSPDRGTTWDCPSGLEFDAAPDSGTKVAVRNFGTDLLSITVSDGRAIANRIHDSRTGVTRALPGLLRCCEGSALSLFAVDTAGTLRVSGDGGASFGVFRARYDATGDMDGLVADMSGMYVHLVDSGWFQDPGLAGLADWEEKSRIYSRGFAPSSIPANFRIASAGHLLFGWTASTPQSGYQSIDGGIWKRYSIVDFVTAGDASIPAANSIINGYLHCEGESYVFLSDPLDGKVKRVYRKHATATDEAIPWPGAGTPAEALSSWTCLDAGIAFANADGLWKYDPAFGKSVLLDALAGKPAPGSMAALGKTLFALIGQDVFGFEPGNGGLYPIRGDLLGFTPRFLYGDGARLALVGDGGAVSLIMNTTGIRRPPPGARLIRGSGKAGLYLVPVPGGLKAYRANGASAEIAGDR